MPLDKNTSRNQITHYPTYRRFPINWRNPSRKSTASKRKSEGKWRREGERERWRYM